MPGLLTYLSPSDIESRFNDITEEYFKSEIILKLQPNPNLTEYLAILSFSWVEKNLPCFTVNSSFHTLEGIFLPCKVQERKKKKNEALLQFKDALHVLEWTLGYSSYSEKEMVPEKDKTLRTSLSSPPNSKKTRQPQV